MENNIFFNKKSLTFFECLDYKRHGILGTDVAAIMGQNRYKGKLGVYEDKIKVRPIKDINAEVTERFKKEKETNDKTSKHNSKEFNLLFSLNDAIEPIIAECVANMVKLPVIANTKVYRSSSFSFMLSDPKYFIQLPDEETGELQECILFCKRVGVNGIDDWIDGAPYHYEVRFRHDMAVCNSPKTVIAILCENNVTTQVLLRDYMIEADIISEEKSFWNHVEKKEEPAIELYSEPNKSDLIEYARKYMAKKPLVQEIYDPQFEKAASELKKVLEEKSTLENKETELKGLLSNFVKNTPKVKGSIMTLSWRNRSTKSVNFDALKLKYPKIYAEVVTTKSSQSLYFTPHKEKEVEEKAA